MYSSFSPQSKINMLIQENTTLKNKLKLYQTKEQLYKSSIMKIKKYQSEYQKSFINTLNDYKLHEERIKRTYANYYRLLEKHYKTIETKFIEENNSLIIQINQKNNIIKALNKKIDILNEKLNKVEFDFHFKNKELEDEVISKDRKISELNDSVLQMAKDTKDEIKLLKNEFKMYKKEKNNNKKLKNIDNKEINNNKLLRSNSMIIDNNDKFNRTNYFEKQSPLNLSMNDNRNLSINKKIYNNHDINYLINRLYLLENQNKNLIQKLKRKEEELSICNNLKNELLYNNSMNDYFYSIEMENDKINNLKLQNLEKTLMNYGNKINNLKNQYDDSLIRHQHEIQNLRNSYKNNLKKNSIIFNKNSNNKGEENNKDYNINDKNGNNYTNNYNNKYNGNYDINEFILTSSKNMTKSKNYDEYGENQSVQSEDEIKDEYINSQLPKINTLD